MRINESLNFVVPIYGDDGSIAGYVHSIPIARSVFEAHYALIAATFSAIFAEGYGEVAGPKVAALILKDVGKQRGTDPAPLMHEIRRLSCYARVGDHGWEPVPLHQAMEGRMISEDDAAEVMGSLVFFTVASRMLPKAMMRPTLDGAAKLWGAHITSLQPTDWIASLPTSTEIVSSGATEPAAPIVPGAMSTSSVLV